MTTVTFETTILSGLPVVAEATVDRRAVDELVLYWMPKGRGARRWRKLYQIPASMYRRLSDREKARLEREALGRA